jgi:hypothetical protein
MMAHKARPVVLSVILAAGMAGYYFQIFLPRARATRAAHNIGFFYAEDMYPYWFGTRELLLHHRSPYNEDSTRQIQAVLYGRVLDPQNPYERDQHRFSYPLYIALLLAPFAWFPFWVLRACAAAALPLFVVFGVVLWKRAMRLTLTRTQLGIASVLALCSYSLLDALVTQQLTVVVFFAFSLAVWFLANKRFALSGIALAIATIKPQLAIVPVCFLLLWTLSRWPQRRNLVRSLAICTGVLAAVSMFLLPSWPIEWWHTIVSYRHYTVPPLTVYILGGIVGTLMNAFLLLLAIWFSWRSRHDEPTSHRFASTWAFTCLVPVVSLSTGNAVYDHIMILPALLLLLSQWRSMSERGVMRILLWTSAAVFAWQPASATIVFLINVISPTLIRPATLLSAPLRTQPSMPFAVLALLGLQMVASSRHGVDAGSRRPSSELIQ